MGYGNNVRWSYVSLNEVLKARIERKLTYVSTVALARRDINVNEIYLAKRGLTSIPDLSRFRFLRYLWLNNNMIKEVCGRTFSCCLTELYLQNNEIRSISGVLRHLRCLEVLLLHNNQIKGLEETVAELRHMQHLRTANFFLNPFTQDPDYRLYVIHHLPTIQLLDRKEVEKKERKQALEQFSPEHQQVCNSLAFGRRAHTPPAGRSSAQ